MPSTCDSFDFSVPPDSTTLSGAAPTLRTRLEAQAMADFRNGMAKPTAERIRPRLEKIRLL
ncbi:hypothetical protein GFL62_07195 [Rhizobium leguminosarum bv. viciae]|nr:hypothetical protein [Rhizobium leguminosarum bv. viciae]